MVKITAKNESVLELRLRITGVDAWTSNSINFINYFFVKDVKGKGYQQEHDITVGNITQIRNVTWTPIKCKILDKIRQQCNISSLDGIFQVKKIKSFL